MQERTTHSFNIVDLVAIQSSDPQAGIFNLQIFSNDASCHIFRLFHHIVKARLFTEYELALSFHISTSLEHSKFKGCQSKFQ